jgi:hypothetical protein
MPRPHTETIFKRGVRRAERFCRAWNDRWPDGDYRLDVTTRGHNITIVDHLRWLEPDAAMPIARLRYEPEHRTWTLYWATRSGRWRAYDPNTSEQPYIGPLLDQIAQDSLGAFIG